MPLSSDLSVAVLIVAAGRGARASAGSSDIPKQYLPLAGRSVLERAIAAFLDIEQVSQVLPVISAGDEALYAAHIDLSDPRLMTPVAGGATRQLSVLAGLEALDEFAPDLVLIHDGARPLVSAAVISAVIAGLAEADAVLPATPVIDTIKRSSDGRTVGGTEDRTQLFAAQTPQGFRFKRILSAHRRARTLTDGYTDDTAIAAWDGMDVVLSEGSFDNIKITLPGDLVRAEQILGAGAMETRVGNGMDTHRFVAGDGVMLGGVRIPHSARLEGHSDADAVLHVLTDALLGALAEGDIGQHFPPSDARWKGEPSSTFLKFAANRVAARKGRILGLDVTIVTEQPKIGPHVGAMRQSIADIAGIDVARVSVKATTSEGMGFVGRGEGLMTLATATIALART